MTNQRANRTERGQAVVILALLLILLFAFLAVVIDGGNGLTQRRIVQNAADAGAMSGLQYYFSPSGVLTETTILEAVHMKVESHGVEDTDGVPGNDINDNVTVYYTDQEGNRLSSCNPLPCGSIPEEVRGFEVNITHEFSTFIGGIIGQSNLQTNADAVAIARDERSEEGLVDYALLAHGKGCTPGEWPINFDGSGVITGPLHINTTHFISNTGSYSTTYGIPENPPPFIRPLVFLTTTIYHQGDPYMSGLTSHDLSASGTVDETRLTNEGLYDGTSLVEGVYYAGDNEIQLPNITITEVATITFVSNNSVTLGGANLNLRPYIDDLLIYSSKAGQCLSGSPVIVLNVDTDFDVRGLLYAPNGRIETGGSMKSFIGGILANSIRLNGSNETILFEPPLFRRRQIYFDLVD